VIFEKEVDPNTQESPILSVFSQCDNQQRCEAIMACRQLCGKIYDGLDLSLEIEAIAAQNLGDTVLMWGENDLQGFAACHVGTGTEAGNGVCFVKFGAVAPSVNSRDNFARLLLSCEAFAKQVHTNQIVLGVNSACKEAYETTVSAGFRMLRTGIAMHRPNLPGFSKAGDFVIDDLR
jgi:hypothetical protein